MRNTSSQLCIVVCGRVICNVEENLRIRHSYEVSVFFLFLSYSVFLGVRAPLRGCASGCGLVHPLYLHCALVTDHAPSRQVLRCSRRAATYPASHLRYVVLIYLVNYRK